MSEPTPGAPVNTDVEEPLDDEYDEDEVEEITVAAEDGSVIISGADFGLELTPAEARELAQALIETAEEAESDEDDEDDDEG